MPFTIRATNSHIRLGAKTRNRKSKARPRKEIRRTGRRPIRSESTPSMGPQMNCITPQTAPNSMTHSAAAAVSPPANSLINPGRIGMVMPKDTAFSRAEAKINPKAARRRVGVEASVVIVGSSIARELGPKPPGPQPQPPFRATVIRPSRDTGHSRLRNRQACGLPATAHPTAPQPSRPTGAA